MWPCSSNLLCCVFTALILSAADDRVIEGREALAAGRYQEAIRLLEQARDGSSQCEASFYLGLARYRLTQVDQAIIDLQIASQCDPGKAAPRVALAVAYAAKGDDDRALAAFDSGLQIEPGNVEALRAAAMIHLRHERNQEAIIKLERLAAIERDDPRVLSDLGAAYAGTGNLDKAREQFQRVLKLHPNHASALLGLGNVYLKTGQAEEALTLLKKVSQAEPHSIEPRFLLASAYNTLARYSEALVECQEALRLGGRDPEVYYHLARAYRGLGREEDARKTLARFSALRSQSNNEAEARREAARLINQAKPLVQEGKLRDAIELLERASSLDRRNPQVLFRLAGLYYDTQQHEIAGRYAREAIALAPSEWLYHYLLGLVEKSSGRLEAAGDSFQIAVRLNPSAAEAFNQLGNMAMGRRDFSEAIRYFEKATALDSREPAYRLNLEAAQRGLTAR